MSRVVIGISGLLVFLVLGGVGYYLYANQVPAFPLAKEDGFIGWTILNVSADKALIANMKADIEKNNRALGQKDADAYAIYLTLGNDYFLLGDGKKSYDNYNRAIVAAPTKGLPYANMANLFTQLKAYNTAKNAYAKTVELEPGMMQFHEARLEFLTKHFAKDTAAVTAAFTDAATQFGVAAQLLVIEAPWLEGQGKLAEAIKAWQTARVLSSPNRYPAIDAEITRLKAKLKS